MAKITGFTSIKKKCTNSTSSFTTKFEQEYEDNKQVETCEVYVDFDYNDARYTFQASSICGRLTDKGDAIKFRHQYWVDEVYEFYFKLNKEGLIDMETCVVNLYAPEYADFPIKIIKPINMVKFTL